MVRRSFFSLWVVLFLLFPTVAFAQEPTYDEVNEVAEQLNCPTCVGINLSDCQTQTCNQWRGQIGDLLAEGKTKQEILDYFALQYGNRVLLEPPVEGATILLWVLPVIALVAGVAWLGTILRDWKNPATPAPSAEPPAPLADDYLKRVEEDLRT
ncbi:MAG TPA: cytochrome c-type biogenesis protein CcmH [Anaerolineae bacterium]|nr:cytochrome c-type biogenesis protein CcmH [Anaerolineae bacterium]HMR68343.1 cytochrome c-type biogenesis protein CcmH [Anaerolineae bacterium]